MLDIIECPEAVTLEWMQAALAQSGCLGDAVLADLEYQLIGTGKMGDNVRFTLRYQGERGAAPETVVGKFPGDKKARAMAAPSVRYCYSSPGLSAVRG